MKATLMAGTASAFLFVSALVAAPAASAVDVAPPPPPTIAGGTSGELLGTFSGFGTGMNDAVATPDGQLYAAVQYKLDVGGKKVTAYCLQFGVEVNKTAPYSAMPWQTAKVANMGKVTDIVSRHTSIGTPLENPQFEAAAVQAAVWAATGDIKLDALQVNDPVYRNRALELVAQAKDVPEPSSSVNVSATSGLVADGPTVTAAVNGNTGPQAGVPVKVSAPSGVANAATGADGKATVTMAGTGGVPADVLAQVTFAPGVILSPGNGQAMVLAEPVIVDRATSVALATVPKVNPTPTPTTPTKAPTAAPTAAPTTPAPAPTAPSNPSPVAPSASPSTATMLPQTGSSSAPWMVGVALAAAAVGAGVFTWSRMRPSHRN